MKQHKWAKEIHAYADGADIEHRRQEAFLMTEWTLISDHEFTWTENDCHEYRIKPQPKEPKYLYVYKAMGGEVMIESKPSACCGDCIGKIKLEDESC
jgi:hypothetical protein